MRRLFLFVALVAVFAPLLEAQTSWTDPVTTTPSFIQKSFGPYGSHLPGNGEQYCGPTALAMELYWVGANGFSQIAPSSYDPANPADVAAATSLISVLGGLANTSPSGGTSASALVTAMQVYFAAKGIGTSQFTYEQSGTATSDWFNTQLQKNETPDPTNITFTNLLVGWYRASGTDPDYYVRSGGHFVDVVAATTGSDASITAYNPYPSSFDRSVRNIPSSNPQTVSVTSLPSDWTVQFLNSPYDQYQQIQSGTTLGDGSNSKGILQIGQAWTVSTSALPGSAGYAVTPWEIDSTQTINTNSGSLGVIAPIEGTGGLYKTGLGILSLQSTDSLTGANVVDGGVLQSTATSGTPFGTGAMSGSNSAVLQFVPDDTTPMDVSLTLASGSGSTLNVDNGGLILELNKGNNTSLTLTIGGNTDGTTANITRQPFADLEIAPDAGLGALGNSIKVMVDGSGANLPAVTNGIVSPYIIGQDSDATLTGAFLDYISGTGLTLAGTTKSSEVDINNPDVNNTTVYQVQGDVTVGPSSASVYALEVGPCTVGGSGTLSIGSQNSGDLAGVILNGGTISAVTQFGGAEAMVYTDLSGGSITSSIYGSGGLVKFGPGALTLSGNNGATLSGDVAINSGTLVAAGTAATGSGQVYVQSQATLQVNRGGSVEGQVNTSRAATVFLNGGRIDGNVNIQGISGVQPGAVLEGTGTIAGNATVAGTIQAGPVTGIIDFTAGADLRGASFYWQLNTLADNSDSQLGVAWNGLSFAGGAGTILGSSSQALTLYVDISLVDGPDIGDSFWDMSHDWTIFTMDSTGWSGWYKAGNFSFDDGSFSFQWGTTSADILYTPFNPVPEVSSGWLLIAGLSVLMLVRVARLRNVPLTERKVTQGGRMNQTVHRPPRSRH